MTFIRIDDVIDGGIYQRLYQCDTPAQMARAQAALRATGLREAPIWVAPFPSVATMIEAGEGAAAASLTGQALTV